MPNSSHVLEVGDIQVKEDLTIDARLLRILDMQTKNLRGKYIRIVIVLWDEATQEMTWELEDFIKTKCPHIFGKLNNFWG